FLARRASGSAIRPPRLRGLEVPDPNVRVVTGGIDDGAVDDDRRRSENRGADARYASTGSVAAVPLRPSRAGRDVLLLSHARAAARIWLSGSHTNAALRAADAHPALCGTAHRRRTFCVKDHTRAPIDCVALLRNGRVSTPSSRY